MPQPHVEFLKSCEVLINNEVKAQRAKSDPGKKK